MLKAAATDAGATNTIDYADVMTFDFNKSRLFYDAVTERRAMEPVSLMEYLRARYLRSV